MFRGISLGLFNARKNFLMFVPGWPELLTLRLRKVYYVFNGVFSLGKAVRNVEDTGWSGLIGETIGHEVVKKLKRPIKTAVRKRLLTVSKRKKEDMPLNERHLFEPKHSWFTRPERMKLTLVYHDAYKAGKHVDVHLGNGISMIIRVSGKPVEKLIKYHRGRLTKSAQKALLKHVRDELSDKARVPQNWDHDPECAQMDWDKDKGPVKEQYGSGVARQVFHESEIQVMKAGDVVCEFYAPSINADRSMYAYKIYDKGKVPILIVGTSKKPVPNFLPKPDLKYIQGEDIQKYLDKTDRKADTLKYDGAATHVVTDSKGTRAYSPRESVVTGANAEYTGKIHQIASITSDEKIEWMAEFVAYKDGKILRSEEIAGLLNSESLVPEDIQTELRVYRVDKWGRKDGRKVDFWKNRAMQEKIVKMMPDCVKLVELKSVQDTHKDGDEGAVGIPKGGNLWNGYKIKWRDEPLDLTIKSVDFKYGPSSTQEHPKVAGEMIGVDKEGKEYKIGPGQFGNRSACIHAMENPHLYIGKVGMFEGLRGHKGRSLKLRGWHTDKGVK